MGGGNLQRYLELMEGRRPTLLAPPGRTLRGMPRNSARSGGAGSATCVGGGREGLCGGRNWRCLVQALLPAFVTCARASTPDFSRTIFRIIFSRFSGVGARKRDLLRSSLARNPVNTIRPGIFAAGMCACVCGRERQREKREAEMRRKRAINLDILIFFVF